MKKKQKDMLEMLSDTVIKEHETKEYKRFCELRNRLDALTVELSRRESETISNYNPYKALKMSEWYVLPKREK